MMMWSRFIRILSEMQKGSKYFLRPLKQKSQTSLAFGMNAFNLQYNTPIHLYLAWEARKVTPL